jgi:hypothetical protein
MRKINLTIVLILTGYCVFAQSDYVVTLKTDTLKGDTRILSYDQMDRVQISKDGKKEMFTALQVLVISIDNELFKPVKIDNSIRLMKIIKSGYLSLYGFKLPNQGAYDGRFLVKLDGTSMEMPNLGFKKIMAGFLEDCSELSEKIKKGEIGKAKIEEIIDQYNMCLLKAKPVSAAADQPDKANKIEAIQNLKNKIKEQNIASGQDALDILNDIQTKVERNESVSNYLLDGLQSTLKDQASLSEDLDKLIALLKK